LGMRLSTHGMRITACGCQGSTVYCMYQLVLTY